MFIAVADWFACLDEILKPQSKIVYGNLKAKSFG